MDIVKSNESNEFMGVEELLKFLHILTVRRKIIIWTVTIISLPLLIYVIVVPPQYIARITILPAENTVVSPLKSMFAITNQFPGLNLPTSIDKSVIYKAILTSKRIQKLLLETSFYHETIKKKSKLLDILEADEDNETYQRRLDIGSAILDNMMSVSINRENKITTLKIESDNPRLSAEIATAFVTELEQFIIKINTTKAAENTKFIESRLAETLSVLETRETDLKNFRESNMRIEKSPQLQLELGKFMRELKVQEEIYLTLKKEIEISKIEEVKSLPLIQILDKATAPTKKSKPKRRNIMLAGLIFSFLFGILLAVIKIQIESITSDTKNSEYLMKIKNIFLYDKHKITSFIIRNKDEEDGE